MLLREAYERLEWDNPLAFERASLQRWAGRPEVQGPRHVGTSAHMLIEMYLDMERAYRIGGAAQAPPEFVVVCKDVRAGKYLRRWLETIHGTLNLDVDTARVRFLPLSKMEEHIRGRWWFSWAIYCDHAVKDDEQERNLGPYRLVRALVRRDGRWEARDRDANVVCRLTDKGRTDLANAATCPVTVQHGTVGTTYPAYQGATEFNRAVRLREAFRR
jgi:hypothetical protein